MPKPQNPERKKTTILISKDLKLKIRQHAEVSTTRKGYETDEQIIDRILGFYNESHSGYKEPHSTY